METKYTKIVNESISYVKEIFSREENKDLFYHNWDHTKMVLSAVEEISNHYSEITAHQKEDLMIAALFHDVGFTEKEENHEEISNQIAEDFLIKNNHPTDRINFIKELITSTKMCVIASNLFEKIMKDADLAHLGKEDYIETTFNSLFKERKRKVPKMSNNDWASECQKFIDNHQYLTDYAKERFTEIKYENLKKISEIVKNDSLKKKKKKKEKKEKKNDSKKPATNVKSSKGVETMFRVALRNHQTMSQIADGKANTLLSINAIIISIVLSSLFPKFDNNSYLMIPGIILLFFSILTVIMAILTVVPNVNHGTVSIEDVKNKKGNLLFFGNFSKMNMQEFEWSVDQIMEDSDYLYKNLTRDLFNLGKVLERKYNLLRYCYYTFVFGLIVSIMSFIISIYSFISLQ